MQKLRDAEEQTEGERNATGLPSPSLPENLSMQNMNVASIEDPMDDSSGPVERQDEVAALRRSSRSKRPSRAKALLDEAEDETVAVLKKTKKMKGKQKDVVPIQARSSIIPCARCKRIAISCIPLNEKTCKACKAAHQACYSEENKGVPGYSVLNSG